MLYDSDDLLQGPFPAGQFCCCKYFQKKAKTCFYDEQRFLSFGCIYLKLSRMVNQVLT